MTFESPCIHALDVRLLHVCYDILITIVPATIIIIILREICKDVNQSLSKFFEIFEFRLSIDNRGEW